MKKTIFVVCLAMSIVMVRGYAADLGRHGPVQASETLYRIALKYRQPGVTVSQMMMSIFEANPDAFHKGNINRLKLGSTLTIPDPDSVSSLDRSQAYRDASEQIDTYEERCAS